MALFISRQYSLVLSVSAVLMGSLSAQTATSTGGISGTVVGDDNQPVQAAVVANGYANAGSGRASAAANGTFQVSGLGAGNYILCARVANATYLDPCSWSPSSLPIVVTAGKMTTGVRLVMPKGAPVIVRVNAPPNFLGVTATPGQTSPHIVVGFTTARGLFEPLAITSQDAAGTSQQGMIPPNISVKLSVVGRGIQVTDSNGNPVSATGVWKTVTASSSGVAQTITLNVSQP